MIEMILLLIVVMLWILLRPSREWYVVEYRSCSDEKLCSCDPGNFGFDKTSLTVSNLVIDSREKNYAELLHKDGGRIGITQTVFEDLGAALQFLERKKELMPNPYLYPFQKAYLMRVVSKSRGKAVILPPYRYDKSETALLIEFPPHLWSKGVSNNHDNIRARQGE